MSKMTKADLVTENYKLSDRVHLLEMSLKRLGLEDLSPENIEKTCEAKEASKAMADAASRFGFGGTDKEPETEVGYLRRELAYAQGQLHQSHLTVKELCRKGGVQPAPIETTTGKRIDELCDRVQGLIQVIAEWKAMHVNAEDLAAAGIAIPKTP